MQKARRARVWEGGEVREAGGWEGGGSGGRRRRALPGQTTPDAQVFGGSRRVKGRGGPPRHCSVGWGRRGLGPFLRAPRRRLLRRRRGLRGGVCWGGGPGPSTASGTCTAPLPRRRAAAPHPPRIQRGVRRSKEPTCRPPAGRRPALPTRQRPGTGSGIRTTWRRCLAAACSRSGGLGAGRHARARRPCRQHAGGGRSTPCSGNALHWRFCPGKPVRGGTTPPSPPPSPAVRACTWRRAGRG